MNLLHQLANLLGNHQPTGQAVAHGAAQGVHQAQPNQEYEKYLYNNQDADRQNRVMTQAQFNQNFQPNMNLGQPNTQQQPSALQTLLQGGQYNPGFTPLQSSGQGGPGYSANLQPTPYNQGPQNLGHKNPQLKDLGYFYNQ